MAAHPLSSQVATLPASPGCYVFRDGAGKALYVGKAKSLRSRVRSYFQEAGGDQRAFLPLLRAQAVALETFVTGTEKEAAILESSLVRESQPRFNVKLRDDKEFLTLRLDTRHEWPRLELVRRPASDGARYFGPFHSATTARRTLHLVGKQFQLRTCTDRELQARKRPCLQFQIQRCLGPCVFDVDRAQYGAQVRAVALLLDGRYGEVERELEQRMREASAALEFERAAVYRNQLAAVRAVQERQVVAGQSRVDRDVLGLARGGEQVELAVLSARQGRVIDAATYSLSRVAVPDDEVVAAFLRQHYGAGRRVPEEVLVPVLPEGAAGVAEWLSEARAEQLGRRARCRVVAPKRGEGRSLLELATKNAAHAFEQKRRADEDVERRLERLQRALGLSSVPRVIECCDISHLGGEDTVGAIVCFRDGRPDKSRYRVYRVRTAAPGDDYGALAEVLARRFRRGRDAASDEAASDEVSNDEAASEEAASEEAVSDEARASAWDLPDLFVVDGGRGQLGVAVTAARDLGLHDLALAGLAKERELEGGLAPERVFVPGRKNPIALKPGSPELALLAQARDEAHRFANRARRSAGKRARLHSALDEVPGLGPRLRAALLARLGSVTGVQNATDEEILAVSGVTPRLLRALRAHLVPESPQK